MMVSPSFTCPRCGMTSYHPKDVEEGYCGNCHAWTREGMPIAEPEPKGSES